MAPDDTDDIAEHMLQNQILPQILAAQLGKKTAMVSTNPEAEGIEVQCVGCGRTAKLPPHFVLPEGQVVACPQCGPDLVR